MEEYQSSRQTPLHSSIVHKASICLEAGDALNSSTCSGRLWDDSQTAAAVSALRRWCRSCLSPQRGCRSPASRGSGSAWSVSSASPADGNTWVKKIIIIKTWATSLRPKQNGAFNTFNEVRNRNRQVQYRRCFSPWPSSEQIRTYYNMLSRAFTQDFSTVCW